MVRVRRGTYCQVSGGSGLDSGRIGVVLDPRGYSYERIKRDNPGYYRRPDYSREYLLRDIRSGKLFLMFKDRVTPMGYSPLPSSWERFIIQPGQGVEFVSDSEWFSRLGMPVEHKAVVIRRQHERAVLAVQRYDNTVLVWFWSDYRVCVDWARRWLDYGKTRIQYVG